MPVWVPLVFFFPDGETMASYLIELQTYRTIETMRSTTVPNPIGVTSRILANIFKGAASGGAEGAALKVYSDSSNAQQAGAFVLLASGSGTVGPTINGTAATVTWATSDTNSAGLIVAAVNAASALNGIVLARNNVATVTLASTAAADVVDILGYKFTAFNGATTDPWQFDMSGNDTADAAALVAKINAAPGLSTIVFADSAAGVVYIGLKPGITLTAGQIILSYASTMTVANGTFAAGAVTLLLAVSPGKIGNTCVISAAGTGCTIAASRTKLAGGAGWSFTAGTNFAQGML